MAPTKRMGMSKLAKVLSLELEEGTMQGTFLLQINETLSNSSILLISTFYLLDLVIALII